MNHAQQAKMIYTHLKGKTKDKTLQNLFHKLKKKIRTQFEYILEEKSLRVAAVLPRLISGSRVWLGQVPRCSHGDANWY